MLLPETETELSDIIQSGQPLALMGHGTKSEWGRIFDGKPVSLRKFNGIIDYSPAELVMTIGAGTPLQHIENTLKAANQHLAFEPIDLGPVYGKQAQSQTIGGVIACNLSGPRRAFVGAARDFFLGFKGINGRGDVIKAGAKVVKNVTGYDLPKLIAGSFGTLVAMTEVTLKVMPAPETTVTLLLEDIEIEQAQEIFVKALNSPIQPTGAVYETHVKRLLFRLEGSTASVRYRLDALCKLVGSEQVQEDVIAIETWRRLRDIENIVTPKPDVLWLLSVPPANFADDLTDLLKALPKAKAQIDWGGGRVWLAHSVTAFDRAVNIIGDYLRGCGHKTLMIGPDEYRFGQNVFTPEVPIALLKQIRRAFDPNLIFNRGRLHPDL